VHLINSLNVICNFFRIFSSKAGKEDICKATVVNEHLHVISNGNCVQSSKLCHI
jgi:hypothetical protein